jgi:hypothetical protein
MKPSAIRESVFRELARSNTVTAVTAVGQKCGFSIVCTVGQSPDRKVLVTSKGETRLFSNLNTLAQHLQKNGVSQFEVNAKDFQPGRLRSPRPDKAAVLRGTRTRSYQTKLELDRK